MKVTKVILSGIVLAMSQIAMAGGILTNTNQSISFLRNPARDGAIGIDGVYSNPAGVAFLNDGFHLSLNWQNATQTRTITTTNPLFALGLKNNGNATKVFEGEAKAPVIPSFQAAYNKDRWSFQAGFAVVGGGGKCEFSEGLGSFEGYVGGIGALLGGVSQQLSAAGVPVPMAKGYDVDGYMQGRQYYFGLTLGAAYKVTDNLSVYGGLRLLYGDATYKAKLENIKVVTDKGNLTLPEYFQGIEGGLTAAGNAVQEGIGFAVGQYMAAGLTQEQAMSMPAVQELLQTAATLQATGEQLNAQAGVLAPYSNGVNLQSDQTGWGVAPIIGIDYKVGQFNFAAKYEFKTRMRMKNKSTVKEASIIPAVNKFQDGESVCEDSPALLTLGVQYAPTDWLRINAGYHHFYDTDAHQYNHQEKLLDGGTNEYLGGIEIDPIKKLTVSGGFQITRYGLTDEYMNDMSFVVNSWSYGLGAKYQISEHVAVEAAYFRTLYSDYNRNTPAQVTNMGGAQLSMPAIQDSFTRTNHVLGLGVNLTF